MDQLFDYEDHDFKSVQIIYSSCMEKLKSEKYLLDPFTLWHASESEINYILPNVGKYSVR
jgi:hypothetical protein